MNFSFFSPDIFLAFAIGASVLAVIWMVWPLFKSKQTAAATRSSYDLQIYKDQLKEIETDLARGVLNEAEAEASRTEVSRRLLAAADKGKKETGAGDAPVLASRILTAIIVLGIFGAGIGLYTKLGVRGMPDFPMSDMRPSQEIAEKAAQIARDDAAELGNIIEVDPAHLALIEQLQEVLKDRPNDLEGHRMLADNLARIGKLNEARAAYTTVMRILGNDATSADWSAYAEIMIVAADWYVSPDAESALQRAIELDKSDPFARYYIGVLLIQQGQYETAYNVWVALLEDSPPDAPWVEIINSQIDFLTAEIGIEPATTRGPTQEDIQNAEEFNEEERNEMVESMVTQLAERLATEGGPPEEWGKLIVSYGALGRMDEAQAVLKEALQVFADDADAVDMITTAAGAAGVVTE